MYAGKDDPTFIALPDQTYQFSTPAPSFEFKEPEEIVKDVQIMADNIFGYDAQAITGAPGTINQHFRSGFEINPYDDTASDILGMSWELDAPKDALKKGSIVYQYVTLQKTGDFKTKPLSIGCATIVGSAYLSEVDTFNGTSSMKSGSKVVKDRTWTQQNTKERAERKNSFEMSDDMVWYQKFPSADPNNEI